jgi:hypothetical protein
MTIPELPPELWPEITQHLQPFQIRRMMSLNRALLNIALDDLNSEGRVHNGGEFFKSRFLRQIKWVEVLSVYIQGIHD